MSFPVRRIAALAALLRPEDLGPCLLFAAGGALSCEQERQAAAARAAGQTVIVADLDTVPGRLRPALLEMLREQ